MLTLDNISEKVLFSVADRSTSEWLNSVRSPTFIKILWAGHSSKTSDQNLSSTPWVWCQRKRTAMWIWSILLTVGSQFKKWTSWCIEEELRDCNHSWRNCLQKSYIELGEIRTFPHKLTYNWTWNRWGRPLRAVRENAGLRHFCISFTFQTQNIRTYQRYLRS